MILVIGNLRRWALSGRDVPSIEGFRFSGFADLTAALMAEVRPDVVLSALVEESFDAMDLARALGAMAFGGRYRAVTDPLPNLPAVLAEIRSAAPGLDFDVFVLGNAGR